MTLSQLCANNVRYLDEVFDSIIKTEDVVYANAPDLPFIFLFEWNTFDIDLDMDIYEPEGDLLTNRPVIIFLHTGAFFSGNNELDDVTALSISAAKRGYVAISMNYRLGLNVLSSYSGERAVYRGVQDGSAAVRYLREKHLELGIDPNNIFMWGTSAGSFIALHLAYTEDDERPEATYGGSFDPDLGCIDCEGNDYIHSSRPNAIVSCWGAIGDLGWIDLENNIPIIMFHGTSDPVVPFNSGFPLLDIFLPEVYGSNLIHEQLNSLQIYNELNYEEGELHEYWGTVNGNWFNGPNGYWDDILEKGFSFLFNQINYESYPGNNCILNNGEIGFLDCELCCWDNSLLSWLGDGWCDYMGGCGFEGPHFDCIELGFDCGDCNSSWDYSYDTNYCLEIFCNPTYDTNSDGLLDILDIILVVNFILNGDELTCSIDYDNDDVINILDVIAIINMVLENE